MMNEEEALAATTNNMVPTTTTTEADTANNNSSTPHTNATASTTTTPGKNPNGSTTLVTPGARPRTSTDADTEVNTNTGFESAQLTHLKQQLDLANRALAINRALVKRYDILQDLDPDLIARAFEETDPGNNNTTGNFQNTTTTANGTGTGTSLTTAAITGISVNRGDIVRPWMTTAPVVNAVF